MSLFESKVKAIAYMDSTGNKVYPVVVDIKTGIKSNSSVVFTTGDINTAFISVQLMDGTELYNTSNKTIICKIQKPSGEIIERTGIVVSQGIVEFKLGVGGVNEQGLYLLDVLVQWGTGTITTPIFTYTITQSIDGDAIQEDDRYPILENLIITVNSKLDEISAYANRLTSAESKNDEQDLRLKQIEYKNKVQDVYIQGLFSENKDGRLTIDGAGNSLKLEGSKEGLVDVEKVVGNTLVNLFNVGKVITNTGAGQITLDSEGYYNLECIADADFVTVDFILNNALFKNSTKYSIIAFVKENTFPDVIICDTNVNYVFSSGSCLLANREQTGVIKQVWTSQSDIIQQRFKLKTLSSKQGNKITFKLVILEGDYTSKPIPSEYFQGMQSSFENQLVTQEMVDSGEELAENLGKYKCEVEVRGKNLFDGKMKNGYHINVSTGQYEANSAMSATINFMKVKPKTNYRVDLPSSQGTVFYVFYDIYKKCIGFSQVWDYKITPDNCYYMKMYFNMSFLGKVSQIEEGKQTTSHEPYFSRTQTVYLNNPLLKGDEIVCVDGELKHYHKREKRKLNGAENWVLYMGDNEIQEYPVFYFNNSGVELNHDLVCDSIPVKTTVNANTGTFSIGTHSTVNGIRVCIESSKLSSRTVAGFKAWLQSNPVTIIYELVEPYYETIDTDRLLLEIPNNATLSVESIIPCQSVKATYTGNVPSLYKMDEDIVTTQEDLSITQVAVDFLLMSNIGEVMMESFNKNTRGGNNMDAYFASRIIKKALQYEDVITRYPEYKEGIDFILKSEGYGHLIK